MRLLLRRGGVVGESVNTTTRDDELVDYLRRAAAAVYIAMDRVAADDLSPRLKEAAAEIDRLRAEVERLHRAVGQETERGNRWQTRADSRGWKLRRTRAALVRERAVTDQLAEAVLLHVARTGWGSEGAERQVRAALAAVVALREDTNQ